MTRLAPDPLLAAAASRPDALAVSAASFRWTNQELEAVSRRVAGALSVVGVTHGQRVASLLADDAPTVALVHAVRWLGAVLVPLNRRASRLEVRDQLRLVRAAVLVHDLAHGPLAESAVSDHEGTPLSLALAIEPMLVSTAVSGFLRTEVDPDATATVVFTSGTTARAKGAMLTHGNHQTSAEAWAGHLQPRGDDRWLACLPLFHVAGLAMLLRASYWRVPLEIHRRFDPAAVWATLQAGASHVSLVPMQLRSLLDAVADDRPPSSLRAILLGGGPIPAALLVQAREAGLPVVTTYGLTETSSGVAAGSLESDGRATALPGVELRIASGDDEENGETGEILVRGPMVFAGYQDDPDATREALRDGWLHTGDIGSIDAQGTLRVDDRRVDLIISGGENIYPAEVENALLAHADVSEAAVVGQADATWGAVPIAAIVLRPGATVADATLEAHCRERLARYKVPVRFVRLATLPRNAAGKIQRRDVRDSLLEESE